MSECHRKCNAELKFDLIAIRENLKHLREERCQKVGQMTKTTPNTKKTNESQRQVDPYR